MSKKIRVAVVGQPNCGKSTLFNAITGATARVGNYPGITVDRLEGSYRLDDYEIRLIDLPGTYSLTAYSMEEVVARNVIIDERPDVVVDILDAGALERSLYLTVQLMEIGAPIVLALNMIDAVKKAGVFINRAQLSRLMNVPVVECLGRRCVCKERLMQEVVELAGKNGGRWNPTEISYGHDIDPVLQEMTEEIGAAGFMTDRYPARWLALKYMEEDEIIIGQGRQAGPLGRKLESMVGKLTEHTRKTLNTYPEAIIADYRYGFIRAVLKKGVIKGEKELQFDFSNRIDKIITQRILGPLLMLGVLWAMFSITFTLGAYPQDWMESFFDWIGSLGLRYIPSGLLQSLVVSGIINGVGAVLSFTPLILIMFAMLVFLEDLGYMARVAYMLDRVFRTFGLHGSSVMPLIVSGGLPGGCAVPGVMSSRTLKSPKERLATIFTAPFMICGAKTTAFIMITGAFFPQNPAKIMFILVLLSWVFALLVSRVLRWTVVKGPPTPFVMELPPYRLPTWRGIATHTWDRVWQFVKKAGTVIFGVSVLMWVIMTFPRLSKSELEPFEKKREVIRREVETIASERNLPPDENALLLQESLSYVDAEEGRVALKGSIGGKIGFGLGRITKYAGFPWEINIAVIGAFAAKEVFVSTLATAYSMNSEVARGDKTYNPATVAAAARIAKIEDLKIESILNTDLKKRLASDPAYTKPAVWSIMIFLLLYAPCMVTVVIIYKETGWRWTLLTLFGSLTLSYVVAVAVYQLGRLIV